MKKSKFSEEQLVKILREADRNPIGDVAKTHGIRDQTIYAWRKWFGGLEAADVKRKRQLEQQNLKVKKLVAERDLEIEVMRAVAAKRMVGAYVRREQVACVQRYGVSLRRTCALLSVAQSTIGYESVLAKRELAEQFARFGYRRIQVFLEWRGMAMSADSAHRIWRRAGLQVPRCECEDRPPTDSAALPCR